MAKKEFKFDGLIKQAEKQNQQSADYIRQHLIVLEELKQFIPPLTEEEAQQLEDNLRAEGCRDALIVWETTLSLTGHSHNDTKYVLIDGHNRFRICKSLGITFRVETREFENIDAVKDWMINNQLGKRNVSEETKAYLRGIQYRNEKRKAGGTGANQFSKNEKTERTAEKLADMHQVSEKTIRSDEKFADTIDKIAAGNETVKWKLLNRQIKYNKTDLVNLNDESETFFENLATALQEGKDFKQTLQALHPNNKTSIASVDNTHNDKIVILQTDINQAIEDVIKKRSKKSMKKLKQYIDDLEKQLFQ